MPPEPAVLLGHAATACRLILDFTAGRSTTEYQNDALLRSAVERQLEIVGEALAQMVRAHPWLESEIPDLRRIVDFRNVLAHGYSAVEHEVVWAIVVKDVPVLLTRLDQLLRELGDAGLR